MSRENSGGVCASGAPLSVLLFCYESEVSCMAKGKYEKWLEPDGLLLLEAWARDGLTNEQIAHNMGITRETLNVWKNKFSDMFNALKKGKEVVDIEVENALFKRAVGYTTFEDVQELVKDPETGESKLLTVKRIIKEVPPDTTAQIYWLNNRRPELWRNRRNVDLSGEVKSNPFSGLTTAQLAKLADSGDDN